MTSPDWLAIAGPPPVPGPDVLESVVTDAARRATALAAGEPDPRDEDPLADAIRLLAQAPAPHWQQAVARHCGLPEAEVTRLLLAFRHGGTAGVHAAVAATPLAAQSMTAVVNEVAGLVLLAELDEEAGVVTGTLSGVQIRHGPDGRWYPFTRSGQKWWPAAGASARPGAALAAALRARRAR